jgi:glutamate/tyrosine decarboxylase-like PLP-dependent enzyme
VPDPLLDLTDVEPAVQLAAEEARRYLAGLVESPVQPPGAADLLRDLDGPLPAEGAGALSAVRELAELSHAGATRSSGPRFFHFVTGGTTPAALAADWLASAFDQNTGMWEGAPLASSLETVSLRWLRELFGLPADWGGVLTTGATMANFTGLAAARRWWAERHGVDVDEQGFGGLPAVPVFSSGYIHSSAVKALAMLGIGRGSVRRLARDEVGRLDIDALREALQALDGAPAILIANAGEVNAGDFDPIDAMADLATEHGAWLHVDGAFGLFARATPVTADLAAGVERADSVISDGHKWLNVPYDCGFAFVRDRSLLVKTFSLDAAYLPPTGDEQPNYGFRGPESSRRARSLATWATLRAYGRDGYRAMVERHLALAKRLAARVEEAPELELLAEAKLNLVCFRFHPPGIEGDELDDLNRRLGAMVLEDARVFFGTTVYGGRVAFRPAIVNWSTTEPDVDLIVDVVRELGARLA